MARKSTGTKEWRSKLGTYKGRVHINGVRTEWHDLGTDDPDLADERLAEWIATGEPPKLPGRETFASAAERIIKRQEAKGEKGVQNRRHRVRTFALPVMGHIEVASIEQRHIHAALSRMGEQVGATKEVYAADTVHHLRTDISRILAALKLDGVLKHNVARETELPDDVEVDDRPRVVLTDEEVMRFRRRGFEHELDMMALFARDLGGHRTSDLHAADYADFDTVEWTTCLVRRPKTDREGSRKGRRKGRRRASRAYERVRIAIPESVVGPLKVWWAKAGKPTTGPVFPLRRGPNVGKRKTGKGISYAQSLRDALWEEGIVRPLPARTEGGKLLVGYEAATGEERRLHCALQVDTDETRAVDFRSFRRAFVTGLQRAGVNEQTAMLASGHGDPKTHRRYLAADVVTVPAGALPGGSAPSAVSPAAPASSSAGAELLAETSLEGAAAEESSMGGIPSATSPAVVSTSPASMPSIDAAPVARGVAEVLTELLAMLRGGAVGAGNSPVLGLNELSAAALGQENPEEFQWRARRDSNLRPTASEGAWHVVSARNDPGGGDAEPPGESPNDPAIAQVAGYCPTLSAAPVAPSQLEQLRAAAKTALDDGNLDLLRGLLPLIEAESKRGAASAPVSLEVVRAKREAGK
jgi:hypothetical protein